MAIGKGRTYAELEDVRTDLTSRIAAAQAAGDPELPRLQKELGELTGQPLTAQRAVAALDALQARKVAYAQAMARASESY